MIDKLTLAKEIEERLAKYKEMQFKRKPLVDAGRKPIPVDRYPAGLDFSKTIGNTTYVVKSHFNQNVEECLLGKVLRLLDDEKNLPE